MKMVIFILVWMVITVTNNKAQSRWSFELHGGDAYNVPLPLAIRQQGYPEIKLTARYYTEAFELPIYYDVRICHWQEDKSWELEFIHHKLYLENTPPEVQKFNVSHGFNMIFLNRGIQIKSFRYHAGAGIVLAHPESTVRGSEFEYSTDETDWGYFLSGPAIQMAVSRPFYLGNRFYINAEAKTTAGYGSIRIAQGNADVYNIAFHLLLGLGMDFK
ncbi:MAG TPA: hypothetical protein VGK10_01200 [Prolixibacteraceae bacterium]|jgi:hypothetical protein